MAKLEELFIHFYKGAGQTILRNVWFIIISEAVSQSQTSWIIVLWRQGMSYVTQKKKKRKHYHSLKDVHQFLESKFSILNSK